MQDEFVNRLGMFQTALGVLHSPQYQPVWFNQPPTVFSIKVNDATAGVTALETLAIAQETPITGAAADKDREEKELEDVAFHFGCALGVWFRDQNDETNAAKVELPISGWRHLRGQTLLDKAKLVRDLGQSVVAGPQSATAATYGVTAAAVTSLSGEITTYEAVFTAPQQSIAQRKGLTGQFRPQFNAVEAKFVTLDCLIVQFATTPTGVNLVAAFQAGRVIRDLGHGPTPPPVPPPTPPGPGPTPPSP